MCSHSHRSVEGILQVWLGSPVWYLELIKRETLQRVLIQGQSFLEKQSCLHWRQKREPERDEAQRETLHRCWPADEQGRGGCLKEPGEGGESRRNSQEWNAPTSALPNSASNLNKFGSGFSPRASRHGLSPDNILMSANSSPASRPRELCADKQVSAWAAKFVVIYYAATENSHSAEELSSSKREKKTNWIYERSIFQSAFSQLTCCFMLRKNIMCLRVEVKFLGNGINWSPGADMKCSSQIIIKAK